MPLVLDGRLHLIGGRAPIASANAGWRDHADVDEHFVLDGERWRRAAHEGTNWLSREPQPWRLSKEES